MSNQIRNKYDLITNSEMSKCHSLSESDFYIRSSKYLIESAPPRFNLFNDEQTRTYDSMADIDHFKHIKKATENFALLYKEYCIYRYPEYEATYRLMLYNSLIDAYTSEASKNPDVTDFVAEYYAKTDINIMNALIKEDYKIEDIYIFENIYLNWVIFRSVRQAVNIDYENMINIRKLSSTFHMELPENSFFNIYSTGGDSSRNVSQPMNTSYFSDFK